MRRRVLKQREEEGKGLKEERMVTMIVRGMPETLRREVKASAARQGKTMSVFIVESLQAAVERSAKKGGR